MCMKIATKCLTATTFPQAVGAPESQGAWVGEMLLCTLFNSPQALGWSIISQIPGL
jgi:hypothetical protein